MANNITHVAYSDESYQTASRYRSVAVVTLSVVDEPFITQTFDEIIRESGVSEFKWEKLRQARERFAALKMLDKTIELALQGRLRVDVLIWDTHDSRHQISGRDDVANLQRMYYHLLKNVLQRRWPAESIWKIHPDENTAMDWMTVQDFLDAAGQEFRIDSNLFEGGFRLRLERDFSVLQIVEACSVKTPLSQLADLLAGLGAFSHSAYDKYEMWLHSQSGQLSLFGHQPCQVSNRERERFTVIEHLDEQCKKHKLRVGLKSSRGFRTHDPQFPVNFWLYEPQHPDDKAPTREAE
ncbi:MAG: DUF3800 domain-containing protein [Anaerolineae bacterium]